MFLKPITVLSSTVATCTVLLRVTISVRKHYCHKRVKVTGSNIAVSCAVYSCAYRYQGDPCTPEQHSLHHNSPGTSFNSCHVAGRSCFVHILIFISVWWSRKWDSSDQAIFSNVQVTNFAIPCPTTGVSFCRDTKSTIDSLLLLKPSLQSPSCCALGYAWGCTCIEFRRNLSCCCPSATADYVPNNI